MSEWTMPPLIKSTLQSTFLGFVSNILAQIIQAYRDDTPFSLNLIELTRFVVMTILVTPPNYFWQQWLEDTFPAYPVRARSNSDRTLPIALRPLNSDKDDEDDIDLDHEQRRKRRINIKNTLWKWLIDCFLLGAFGNISLFLFIMALLKGLSWPAILDTVRTETLPIVIDSYKLWPIPSIISFIWVPVEKRVVFLAFINLLWNVYLSFTAARV